MLVCIPNVLDAAQLVSVRERLDRANEAWVDGRVTAGYQGAPVKFNQQVDEQSAVALACQRIVVSALERNPIFISAVLPNVIYPPMFNRYSEGMKFGAHVDGSVRLHPQDGRKLRTDVSATLFLTNPDEYDGGELQVEDTYGRHSIKLGAGDMVVYPATSLHQVSPITRGVRTSCFFWIQSLIRDDSPARAAARHGQCHPAPQPDECRRGCPSIADRLLSQSRAAMERDLMAEAGATALAAARVNRRLTFVRWVRRTHGWFGLWGAILGLMMGFSGIWLNHRNVLKLQLPDQQQINAQLVLPEPRPATIEALAGLAAAGLEG